MKKEDYCPECKKKLKASEMNPNNLCNKCWKEVLANTDYGAIDKHL